MVEGFSRELRVPTRWLEARHRQVRQQDSRTCMATRIVLAAGCIGTNHCVSPTQG
jgi:hypothetical protein